MITLPELAAEALGSFLASDMKDRFGTSHARLAEVVPFAARMALECIGNSDVLYHNRRAYDARHFSRPRHLQGSRPSEIFDTGRLFEFHHRLPDP
jgi:hypothetical protein